MKTFFLSLSQRLHMGRVKFQNLFHIPSHDAERNFAIKDELCEFHFWLPGCYWSFSSGLRTLAGRVEWN